jgi:hypothetical protein
MTRTRTLIIAIALAVVAASCSSGGDSSEVATLEPGAETPSQTSGTTADPLAEAEGAMLEFTQCLRDQGIDVGDPTIGPDGSLQLPPIEFAIEGDGADGKEPDLGAFEEMIAPCEELLSGIGSVGSNADASEFEDALVEYSQCMRDNGVDMPDPDFSSEGGIIDLDMTGADGDDFEAADAVCRSVFESFSIGG